ncbi:MAG: RsmB/NOP family class I SAM-dependent RNA methyltransferase [Thermoproteota archaeon]
MYKPRTDEGANASLQENFAYIMERWKSAVGRLQEIKRALSVHEHQLVRYAELFRSTEELARFLLVDEQNIMKTIRVNTLLTGKDELKLRLSSKGVKVEDYRYLDYGLVVTSSPYPIGALHEYLLGLFTIQGPASMLVVPALRPEDFPRGRIIDMCAGAGIKTTQIAQHAPKSRIVAVDVNRRKLLALKNNTSRMAVFNVVAVHMDARLLPSFYRGKIDAVLLDAPCSGEGLLPFPRARRPRTFKDILGRVALQLELLKAGLDLLRDGGVLVYATCSLSVEENEYVITRVLEAVDNVEVEDLSIPGLPGVQRYGLLQLDPRVSRCRRLYPHIHGTEGFTICRLAKTRR